ncbi:hypothetical protein [Azospirillum sp. A29]|uniref:hypothetical protein n=1 Tax=unclassified Azospirillum TaxID=2630922 RepID=UPI00366F3536
MTRTFAVAAVALLATLHIAEAAGTAPLDGSLSSRCDQERGRGIQDYASDPAASLVVEVTLFDSANRVIEQVPFITQPNAEVSAHSVERRSFALAGRDGAPLAVVCTGHVTAVRVTPHTSHDASVELVVEAASLRRSDLAAEQRKLSKAPEPDQVRVEETLRMHEGERVELKVGGSGPVRRVAVAFGRTR